MAENAEIGSSSGNCDNETVKRSPSNNLNRSIDYLISDIKKACI